MRAGTKAALESARPMSALTVRPDSNRSRLDSELEALEGLGLDDLCLQWRNRWGRLAPAHLSRSLLFRLMAYRIQAQVFGGLDRQTARQLDRLAQDAEKPNSGVKVAHNGGGADPTSPARTKSSAPPLMLKAGALLTREWQGRIERVMALEKGFAWNGRAYASLSAVAFAITGVKWNGHRFFFGSKGRGGKGGGVGETTMIEERKSRRGPALPEGLVP
jgi:hypothetical protein